MNKGLSEMTGIKEVNNKEYFPALTGIRAISAYFVFLHHFNPATKGTLLYDFMGGLHIGVTIFFVLSGFLIAYRYYGKGPIVFKKYFLNRFARIYPMYFLLTTVTFLYAAIVWNQYSSTEFKLYLLNITFIRGFFDNYKFTGIGQGWSLTVEETFYLLAPLFFILIKGGKKYLVLLPVVCVIVGLLLVSVSNFFSLVGFFSSNFFMFAYTFFGRAFEFFMGIGLALFFKAYKDKFHTAFCTYAGCAGIFLSIVAFIFLKRHSAYEYGVEHPVGLLINNFFMPLLGIVVLFWGLLTEKTWLQRFLKTNVMVLLGKSSYIFYLVHLGIFYTIISSHTSSKLLIFITLNVLSVLLYLFIEEPANKFLRKSVFADSVKQSVVV